MDAYNKRIEEGRAVNMDTWIDEAENRGREEGRTEGRKDAILQSVNNLMTKKGWSMAMSTCFRSAKTERISATSTLKLQSSRVKKRHIPRLLRNTQGSFCWLASAMERIRVSIPA